MIRQRAPPVATVRRLPARAREVRKARDLPTLEAGRLSRVTLVLYRKRTARRFRLASTSGVRFRYSRQKEAVRGCGGRGALWKFNRFLPDTPCQTGTLVKTPLLMLIDICLAIICVILPPAPSVLQAGSSDACVYTRGSVRRASGFVLTGFCEVSRGKRRSPVQRSLVGSLQLWFNG